MYENGQLTILNIQDILPNRFQPRIRFDEEKLEELAASISKYGVIQPIVVRPVSNKYEIIAGERRFKASKLANKSTIPAIIVNLSDKDSEEIALLENIQRHQLSPIEEAVSYKRILDMGYITQEELAKKIGKSQSTIANKIRLLSLDDEVQNYLLNNKISERHARSLLKIHNNDDQVMMLHRIVNERLTVKQTDKEIEKLKGSSVVNPINLNISKKPEEIESLFDEKEERGKGFMDIEKIMREAKDINQPTVQQPRDISSLMNPTGMQKEASTSTSSNFEQVNLEPSKFISVQPVNDETPVQKPTVNNTVTFDSVFGQSLVSSVQPSNAVNPSRGNNQTSVNTQMNSTSISENNQTNLNPSSEKIQQKSNFEISNETKSIISTAVAEALKKFNESKNHINQPSQNNVRNNINVPDTNIIADNTLKEYVNPIHQTNFQPTMASTISQEVKPVNNQAHFAQIVKMLRDCADKIEQGGYHVFVDELDLGSQYKVTFTIDKE